MLGAENITYPTDTPFSRNVICSMDKGQRCNLSDLHMSAHSGTHIDTPCHFINNGKTIDELSLENFIIPATVVDIKDIESIKTEEFKKISFNPNEAILFKTNNSKSGIITNGIFDKNFVYLAKESADLIVEKKIKLVGIDYITIDKYGDENPTCHEKLLSNDIIILESINLKDVAEGKYTLICLPLKIKGGEGSPVRAVLVN